MRRNGEAHAGVVRGISNLNKQERSWLRDDETYTSVTYHKPHDISYTKDFAHRVSSRRRAHNSELLCALRRTACLVRA